MLEIVIALVALIIVAVLLWLGFKINALTQAQAGLPGMLQEGLEARHRTMLTDLHNGLANQSDRTQSALTEVSERLRHTVAGELTATREAVLALQHAQTRELADSRTAQNAQLADFSAKIQAVQAETLAQTLQTLAKQGREEQALIQTTMQNATTQLSASVEALAKSVDARLAEISGKVSERLDEGFKKTNETFANVMARLATIDEAQKKIDGLSSNVLTLQELLGDKRSRGAFGEVQLEGLVRNIMPPDGYSFQTTLSNGSRVDCLLMLPEPTGRVAVDSKFPLENYNRMFARDAAEADRTLATRAFKADVKKHVDDIAAKYIIAGETSDGAVMFVPAEAVFAEIHAYHSDLVEYAMSRRVWIVSPTTLMAVLNTARAVIKDVETRRQVHIIKDELSKLGKDFSRFDVRMKKLADHIRLANEDATEVHISSQKISKRFSQIESVDLEHLQPAAPLLPDAEA
ncbi:DNA recombination protein RmuC [Sulfuriferula multivorans]|uniref:DNA recombination protein RmuC n=1 Tax=Sulfuriferula multivorans TaxID=1559896 RepID=A0A401JYW6_9PROT|nr:DNA recombination protein RmuC [Sulfuriferula multivorans]GCB02193.1 DNA recombination protein RmuC [Sulfuriferula multivorans]